MLYTKTYIESRIDGRYLDSINEEWRARQEARLPRVGPLFEPGDWVWNPLSMENVRVVTPAWDSVRSDWVYRLENGDGFQPGLTPDPYCEYVEYEERSPGLWSRKALDSARPR